MTLTFSSLLFLIALLLFLFILVQRIVARSPAIGWVVPLAGALVALGLLFPLV